MVPLRVSEAQQLYDALQDPLLRPALQSFFQAQELSYTQMLIDDVKKPERNTMKEASLAGKVDLCQTAWLELEHFAERMLKQATL